MRKSETIFPDQLRSEVENNMVVVSRLEGAQFRLDAPAFLSSDKFASLMPNRTKSQPLAELADVFTVYIQSPILAYVSQFAESRPYLTTSELAEYQAGRVTHVSLLADRRLLEWEIRRGNIVVSRSGRVGEAYWVDKKLDGALVGDSFRVVPKKPADGPFIYAVLSSNFARNFLSGSAYGSVIDHASVDQLRNFPMPELASTARADIASTMSKAISAREHAYDLLDEAQSRLLKANRLPPLDVGKATREVILSFEVTSADIMQSAASTSEFRIEAHFHNPFARMAISAIQDCPSRKRTVGTLSHDVIIGGRSKRNYVESAYGTPFLSGKNIVQARPSDIKHVSNTETDNLEDMLLRRGWILVTRSGTIGRMCFVWNNFEKYAASEHCLRVLPNEDLVDGGYLYAFLISDYGYEQIIRFRFGSVIDEISNHQLKQVIVPLPPSQEQKEIGNLVRLAYEDRADALRLEDKAQELLMREINAHDPETMSRKHV
jgi:type I restriction enzyme S subunit